MARHWTEKMCRVRAGDPRDSGARGKVRQAQASGWETTAGPPGAWSRASGAVTSLEVGWGLSFCPRFVLLKRRRPKTPPDKCRGQACAGQEGGSAPNVSEMVNAS